MKIVSIEEELGKNPQLKQEDIDHMKSWIFQEKCVPASVSDVQIALFLHCCHYSVDATKDLMKVNYKWRVDNSSYCTGRNPKLSSKLERTLNTLACVALPKRSSADELMLFIRIIDNTPKDFHIEEIVKLLFMFLDLYLVHHGSSNGVVIIIDVEPVTFALSRRLSTSAIRAAMTYVQDGISFNVNAIHVINSHAILDLIFAMAKPFIKSDLMKKIHFHREGSSTFLSHLAPTYVPRFLGGEEETPLDQLHKESLDLLQSFEPWFEEEENALQNFKLTQSQKKS